MSTKAVYFLEKTLGEDLFESLQKTELYKPDTRTVTSLEDIHLGLKLVPRTIMALLIRELVPMQIHEHKDIRVPVPGEALLHVEKLGPDVYSGHVIHDNKKIAEFAFRPVPGVALVLMSSFELYDIEKDVAIPQEPLPMGKEQEIQKIIDERLALHDLVARVVDKKIEQKDAIQQLMLAKLTEALKHEEKKNESVAQLAVLAQTSAPMEDQYFRGMANGLAVADAAVNEKEPTFVENKEKGSPLKSFLDKRESKKLKKNEFYISLEKNEKVDCSDCGKEIFNETGFSGCICYGADRNSKVSIQKSENGVKISFGRGWDKENLEMLLEVLRSKNG